MKKSIFLTAITVFLAVLMLASFACSGGKDEPKPTDAAADKTESSEPAITAEELYQKALAVSGFGNMTAVTKRDYAEIYGIDTNKFVDQVWYQSDNPSLNADEIGAFLVMNDKEYYVETLTGLIQKHLDTRISVAESYSPEEAGKLRQAEVTTAKCSYGTWVYFCVGDEYAAMMDAFAANVG